MTKHNSNKLLTALFALGAVVAMPLALAQDAQTSGQSQPEEPAKAQAAGAAEQATHSSSQSASQPGWADIDQDGDGNINKQEAAANAGLAKVFDKADANGDGKLTADEYKAFVEQNYDKSQK